MLDDAERTPHGRHLIAGDWVAGESRFRSSPATGEGFDYAAGSAALIDRAAQAAEEAFWRYGYASRESRAAFLDAIAEEIDARGAAITAMGMAETGLPEARLQGERGRTVGQIRLFAALIREEAYLDKRHDAALPERQPLARPDLRLIQRPIGPVGVFGASNFPLAFSTAGGDTASALAAGCPVIVKGHEAHPGVAEIVAEAIDAAIKRSDVPAGVFSLVHGGDHAVGQALARHPLIQAIGFTGSLRAGRALFDLCAARPEPIPFFGELGSVNPMFLLPGALAARADQIGAGWAGSLTMGAGQFCTNPGIAILLDGPDADRLAAATKAALEASAPQTMLTDGVAAAFREGADRVAGKAGVRATLATSPSGRTATPFLFETDARSFLSDAELGEEVFGPLAILIRASSEQEMIDLALALRGQLTATLHVAPTDQALAARLLPILERKAGRILANGFPTGVEVADAMVHGGPYPASTNFGHSSVGTLAIRRFLRPVCFQNLPEALLPADLAS